MLSPENEFGNIEYKYILINKNSETIDHLATQMRYRTDQGNGECFYIIGVKDNGMLTGLTEDDFLESFNNLSLAAAKNNYSINKISEKKLENDKKVYELIVREVNENKYIDIKIAISGSVDAGKSSLLSVITNGKLDNGNGSARLAVFNYQHEIKSGRTSSVAQHILGFDGDGKITNYCKIAGKKSWPDIVRQSAKIISLFDLCGHEKYLKTTIMGMSSSYPDVCFIIVGANMGINKITNEHMFLCITLGIPFVIIITKIDICENRKNILRETISKINKLLKLPGVRKIPYKVNNKDDVILCSKNIYSDSIVPIFHVSNVTGFGIDYIKQFLNVLSKNPLNIKSNDTKLVEYHIDTTFYVQGIGTIVGGHLLSGSIKVGDKLIMGPNNGKYESIIVKSIHCKRVNVQHISYGSYVCLALRKINRDSIRKGSVIISSNSQQIQCLEFEADIKVLKSHSTTIRVNYEPIVHTHAIRQSAKIISISNKVNARDGNTLNDITYQNILRTGDTGIVKFSFKHHPEYIKKGYRILFAEGKVKMIGIVR